MELTHLKTFLTVARKGNLSAAARELGATQPNVGRQMTALSKEVGIDLFVRHSRGLDLTHRGKEFFDLCQRIIGELDQGTSVIKEKDSEPEGILRIVTEVGASDALLEHLDTFIQKFPKLNFMFLTTTDIYQFQIGDADVGIVPTKYNDPDITQHHLYDLNLKLFASPDYIKNHSFPKHLKDLASHRLIVYSGSEKSSKEVNFHLHDLDNSPGSFVQVNNGRSLRSALVNGLGIGPFGYEENMVKNNLVIDLFPEMPPHKIPYYFTYHKRLESSPKIKAFHEFMKSVVKIW